MCRDENIAIFFLLVNDLKTSIKGLGIELKEVEVAKKVLRSFSKSYFPKVFSIEEYKDVDNFIVNQFYCSMSAFEMGDFTEVAPKRETTFKVNKKTKYDSNQYEGLDEVEVNFLRKLKKGIGKYNGKLPFKYFNCGRIGHFLLNLLLQKIKIEKIQKYRERSSKKAFI